MLSYMDLPPIMFMPACLPACQLREEGGGLILFNIFYLFQMMFLIFFGCVCVVVVVGRLQAHDCD